MIVASPLPWVCRAYAAKICATRVRLPPIEQNADCLLLHWSREIFPAQRRDESRHAARARPLSNEVILRPKAVSRTKGSVRASLNHMIHLFRSHESYEW